uniref:Uncharacterized protein n=1 Tax=Globodera rostochiensis TaxID=31243 RepID=A0A914H2A1_GLORO
MLRLTKVQHQSEALPFTPCNINGEEILALVDTGSEASVIPFSLVTRMSVEKRTVQLKAANIKLKSALLKPEVEVLLKMYIRQMTIGGSSWSISAEILVVKDEEITFHGFQMIMGMDIIKKLGRITMIPGQGRIIFEPNTPLGWQSTDSWSKAESSSHNIFSLAPNTSIVSATLNSLPVKCLIDTGATVTVAPKSLALQLQCKISSSEMHAVSASGHVIDFREKAEAKLEIGGNSSDPMETDPNFKVDCSSQYDLGSFTEGPHHFVTTTEEPVSSPPRRMPYKYRDELKQHIEKLLAAGVMIESDTPWVTPFVMLYMPFGLKNATAAFSRAMAIVLSGLEECAISYVDDVLVFTRNGTFDDHLNLSRQSVKFEWKDEQQKSFEKLKELLTKAPNLVFPNYNQPFHIFTDASLTGLGGVLMQKNESSDGFSAISYCSRTLSAPERRWPAVQIEMCAIIYALREFRPFFFSSDAAQIGRELKAHGLDRFALSATADSMQGHESDLVVVVTTVSQRQTNHQSTRKSRGNAFWGDPARVNVSLSRGKHGLVVIGNLMELTQCKIWDRFLSKALEGTVVATPSFIRASMDEQSHYSRGILVDRDGSVQQDFRFHAEWNSPRSMADTFGEYKGTEQSLNFRSGHTEQRADATTRGEMLDLRSARTWHWTMPRGDQAMRWTEVKFGTNLMEGRTCEAEPS